MRYLDWYVVLFSGFGCGLEVESDGTCRNAVKLEIVGHGARRSRIPPIGFGGGGEHTEKTLFQPSPKPTPPPPKEWGDTQHTLKSE